MWISWFVLAACAVIAQSSPQPDEYQIPVVPSNSRAQYYVLHDDGDFKYGYDTGDGAYESAVKMAGELSGFFGFNDASGQNVRVDYTAGADGFKPSGAALPVAPSLPVGFEGPQPVVFKSAIVPQPEVVKDDFRSENEVDGSYAFAYENPDSSRHESADSDNNVVGEYSFVADGRNHHIRYHAGSSTGYVAEGDSLPASPEQPLVAAPSPSAATYSVPAPIPPPSLYSAPSFHTVRAETQSFQPRGDASYSFNYETSDSAREETADSDLNVKGRYSFIADDGVHRKVNYIAGSSTGFVAEADHLPVAPVASESLHQEPVQPLPTTYTGASVSHNEGLSTLSQTSPQDSDASYQFSYNAGDSSRSESSDSDLNVRGDFSFVAPDGLRRTVEYVAGSSTGFVAAGDHLPEAPEPLSDTGSDRSTFYSASSFDTGSAASTAPRAPSSVPADSNAVQDASYQFSYNAGDSSRSESSDSDLNVQGDYSFVAPDGLRRTVEYVAGSSTGFVAQGDHLPVAPVTGVDVGDAAPPTLYSAPYEQPETSNILPDSSYQFNFNTGESSRSESSDSDLNVRGDFSFVAPDGLRRTVEYVAGSSTGFIAKGDHLPVAPEAPVDVGSAPTTFYNAPVPSSSTASIGIPLPHASGSVPSFKTTHAEEANIKTATRADGGYSFSYTNSDSSRTENADSSNNVVGQYTFVADDGKNRQVNYKAGSGIGFVAEGESIPVQQSVQEQPTPSIYHAPSQLYSAPGASHAASFAETKATQGTQFTSHVTTGVDHQSDVDSDGSYRFSYKTDDSEREESADRNLNVRGRYSFVSDDGIRRNVNYQAGSATGFIADGDHLPVAPKSTAESHSVGAPTQYTGYNVPTSGSLVSTPEHVERGDSSYQFSYQNENSARQESSDSDLNVKGRFSFVGDDGQQRTVNYIAGSSTGFIADGDHLPVAPEPDTPIAIAPTSTGAVLAKPYSAPVIPHHPVSAHFTPAAEKGDASYSFNYNADDSSRNEVADSDLNVRGQFKFVADDGVERTVNYVAGSDTGFVAEGDHLPVPVSDTAAPVAPIHSSANFRTSGSSQGSGSQFRVSGALPQRNIGYAYEAPAAPTLSISPVSSSSTANFKAASTTLQKHKSHMENLIGNVLLRQYIAEPDRKKFGYVFTEV